MGPPFTSPGGPAACLGGGRAAPQRFLFLLSKLKRLLLLLLLQPLPQLLHLLPLQFQEPPLLLLQFLSHRLLHGLPGSLWELLWESHELWRPPIKRREHQRSHNRLSTGLQSDRSSQTLMEGPRPGITPALQVPQAGRRPRPQRCRQHPSHETSPYGCSGPACTWRRAATAGPAGPGPRRRRGSQAGGRGETEVLALMAPPAQLQPAVPPRGLGLLLEAPTVSVKSPEAALSLPPKLHRGQCLGTRGTQQHPSQTRPGTGHRDPGTGNPTPTRPSEPGTGPPLSGERRGAQQTPGSRSPRRGRTLFH